MKPLGLAAVVLVLAALLAPSNVGAVVDCSDKGYVVDTTADEDDATPGDADGPDNKTSLREAVNAANGDGADSTIDLPAGTFYLTAGSLVVNDDCGFELVGVDSWRTTIWGGGTRAITSNAVNNPVDVASLTIQYGQADDGVGGAISTQGPLRLTAVLLTSNQASDGGGGLAVGGELTMSDSTVSGNAASVWGHQRISGTVRGGGILVAGPATLTNSLVTANEAGASKTGAGAAGGGIATDGPLTLVDSTIADNRADGIGATGGGVSFPAGQGTTLNSLFTGGGPTDCSSPLSSNSSGDKSMASDVSCTGTATPDLNLGSSADNGGPVETRALLPGSPAMDGGEAGCPGSPNDLSNPFPPDDQRGVKRNQGPCDVGAFEVVKNANLALTMTAKPTTVAEGGTVLYTVKVTSTGPPGDGTDATVVAMPPPGASIDYTSDPSCSESWQLCVVSLHNGESQTIKLPLTVYESHGSLSNTVQVNANFSRPETNSADNTSTVTVAVVPSSADDLLIGTKASDKLCGLGGDDTINGRAGRDRLFGDACRDVGWKVGGEDTLFGGAGDDLLVGGAGDDVLKGGKGNDIIKAHDRIGKDTIDCGAGRKDFADVGDDDVVKNCETVHRH
jgi:uncharacterized protein DUF11/hemolysin type calcium-binding protein